MDGTDVHPSRGTAGTARGADTVRSNELLDANGANLHVIPPIDPLNAEGS